MEGEPLPMGHKFPTPLPSGLVKPPAPPPAPKAVLFLRLPSDLHQRIRDQARREHTTATKLIRHILEREFPSRI